MPPAAWMMNECTHCTSLSWPCHAGLLPAQDCKLDDNEMATDNALSALTALLEHHADAVNMEQVGP
jgi:hypothetical protein